ncbi:MAG: hypothetical protein ACI9MC_004079 [Kiritimatiellia bacterium]|jgi:hypothetical protein
MHPDFQPEFFAHGRLLWRFDGSDPARFSPRLAWHMVQRAAQVSAGAGVLWDPFCGVGLIPCVARAFFAADFAGICASDISNDAVEVASRNLRLLADPTVAERRKRQLRGLSGQNVKSKARWSAVERYLLQLEPRIERAAHDDVNVQVIQGSADAVQPTEASILIVGDAPYGRQSKLAGAPLPELIRSLIRRDNIVYIDIVATEQQAHEVADSLPEIALIPAKSGRYRLLYEAD